MRIIFFGTPEFSADVLDTLETNGFIPSLVVTQPDKPVGRKMIVTAPPVKQWALSRSIPVLQPETLRTGTAKESISSHGVFDVAIVASYGKIIPQEIIDMAPKGFLNIHPSLLPRHRGASPIHSTILEGDAFGVTIIRLDSEMDHGPILAQEKTSQEKLPSDSYRDVAEKVLAHEGALLLSTVLTNLTSKEVSGTPQDHTLATFCKKIQKSDGLVDIKTDNPTIIARKVRAFIGWPSTFFMTTYNNTPTRVQITKAHVENNQLVITEVKPEGKREMSYSDFLNGSHSK